MEKGQRKLYTNKLNQMIARVIVGIAYVVDRLC